ncbi:MAG TPA: hypothetical protein VLG71_00575 [Candidatus Limnocylindria bacterium]|nr:hypothetical protein [Candidatus Limnocylindria bacterium]
MAVLNTVQNTVGATVAQLQKPENRKLLVIIAGCLVVLGLCWWGYSWYSAQKEKAAQQAFADCVQEYEQAQAGQVQWPKVEQLSKLSYDNHSGSNMAPYFLALQAEALLKQQKADEAIVVLDKVVSVMPSGSPVYALHATKRALVKLDRTEEAMHAAGLQELTTLAYDQNNNNRDMALYYLGLYHWIHNDLDKAKKEWFELLNLQKKEEGSPSPWAVLAQDKLRNIQ